MIILKLIISRIIGNLIYLMPKYDKLITYIFGYYGRKHGKNFKGACPEYPGKYACQIWSPSL